MTRFVFLISSLLACSVAQAAPPDVLRIYAPQAFSAARGEQFYHAKRQHSGGKVLSCATCHTDNPKATGQHEKTGKEILPLAPAANRDRLADPAKVEKWFKRNCQDVLERACTAQEKGDFLSYLLSIK